MQRSQMFPPPTEREQIDQRYCLSQMASLFAHFCATVTGADTNGKRRAEKAEHAVTKERHTREQ